MSRCTSPSKARTSNRPPRSRGSAFNTPTAPHRASGHFFSLVFQSPPFGPSPWIRNLSARSCSSASRSPSPCQPHCWECSGSLQRASRPQPQPWSLPPPATAFGASCPACSRLAWSSSSCSPHSWDCPLFLRAKRFTCSHGSSWPDWCSGLSRSGSALGAIERCSFLASCSSGLGWR